MKKIAIYIATHRQKLEEDEWHVPIQVGADGSSIDIQETKDNTGEHISDKNASYCELTALYWIWKNSQADVVGLEHYRRRFHVSRGEVCTILEKYDIILPKEYLYRISLEDEYKQFHIPEDWENMKEVLLEEYPDYKDFVEEVFGNNALIPYNMFIAEKKVCDAYCTWLFPILEKLEQKRGIAERDSYQSRYIGFLSERLFTLYVKKNHLKIYECRVDEREHETLFFAVKNWFGQHVFNPLVFQWKRKK